MLTLCIDRDHDLSLAEQVSEQVQGLIATGTLRVGARLPSSRRLADQLGLSRNTVVLAYERLLIEGWVEAGVGRGTFVAANPPRIETAPRAASGFPWQGSIVQDCPPQVAALAVNGPLPNGSINFSGAVPGSDTYPSEAIRKVFQTVLRREGARALEYGPPAGYLPLRELIAERATRHGAPTRPGDVLIVGGSQQGLDLLARLLLAPGDVVVVEAPTYSNALQLWRLHGARVLGVPMDERGIQPEPLAALLERARPKLVYLMPTFQNPTGLTMDQERRQRVMEVVRAAQVPVVEDHFDTELRYRGKPLPPLRALDRDGQVVLVGTFSKILCPGFRLGWIIAPPAVRRRLLDLKRICDLSTSLPAQMAVAELCARGELDRHLERASREHAERQRVMLAAIVRHLPEVRVLPPEGGMTVWLELPAGIDAIELHEEALAEGVEVAPGPWFFPEGGGETNLRLSFVGETGPRIEEGIARLGRAFARQLRKHPRHENEETSPFI